MPRREEGGTVSFGGMKLENVPRWSLALGVIVLIGGVVLFTLSPFWKRPTLEVSSAVATRALQDAVNEYGRHIAETPEASATLLDDARGRLTVQRYADGCLLLARTAGATVRSKLVVDLAKATADGAMTAWPALIPEVEAAELAEQPGCLNPHPGPFETGYGRRVDACWVEVWRRWPDGCEHVQMLNTCNGAWDANGDGTPRVRWTRCVHGR